jgi:hypothetical protein
LETQTWPPGSDPSVYPRIYRISAGWKFFLLLLGLALAGGGAFLMWKQPGTPKDAVAFIIIGGVMLLAGAYILIDTMLSKVILYADAIELHDTWKTRRLERADIKGRRTTEGGHANTTIVFIPHDPAKKKLKLPMIIKSDMTLQLWIEGVPDLDLQEREKAEAEILQATAIDGASVEDRKAALASARKTGKVLTTAAGAAAVWAYAFPEPYELIMIIMIVLPWVALGIAARSPGLYSLNDHKSDVRAGLGVPLIIPGLVLILRCAMDVHLLDWMEPLAGAAGIGLFMTFLATRLDRRLIEKKTAILVLVFLIPYGYGTLVMANTLPDTTPSKVYETKVISKRYTSGKGAHAELKIKPWGPQPGGDVAVSGALYRAVSAGDTVCAYLYSGALGVPWYVVDRCR